MTYTHEPITAKEWNPGTLTYSCGCVIPTMGQSHKYDYLCSTCYALAKKGMQ